ncbi:MAG: hypothetical protein R3C09_14145 [Pirellulaceae bacterium]
MSEVWLAAAGELISWLPQVRRLRRPRKSVSICYGASETHLLINSPAHLRPAAARR